MKGFIKVTDTKNREHYLNVYHIVKFKGVNRDLVSDTIISTTRDVVQTHSTPKEIADMIAICLK